MTSTRRNARVAGFFYLLLTLIAPFRLMYIPGALFVRGDATATAGNIVARETLFRIGIVSQLVCAVILIFLTLALFRLFREVDRSQAVLMVVLGGVLPAAIDFLNTLTDAAALMLARGADYLSVFDKPQRDALALLFVRLHHQVDVGASVLWGLWLLPLAILAMRSGFLPRFLGVWLTVNGCAYLVLSLIGLLWPEYEGRAFNLSFPALLGEPVFMLWILIRGAQEPAGTAT